jgi:hypothetical protein
MNSIAGEAADRAKMWAGAERFNHKTCERNAISADSPPRGNSSSIMQIVRVSNTTF